MLDVPPSLRRYFLDASGRFDYRALLNTPDEDLVALARRMPPQEWARLYRQVRGLRLGFVERLMIEAAGVNVERQRRRFLWVLEQAVPAPAR
jgi:hypothetical protein